MKPNDWQETIAMAASAIEDLLETADEQAGCWADVPARLRALTATPAPANVKPVGYLVAGYKEDFEWGPANLFPEPGGGADIPVYLSAPAVTIPDKVSCEGFDPKDWVEARNLGQCEGWNAYRAELLAQPVSSGYTLPDDVREALTLALQAMEFMGDTLNNIHAACTEGVEYVTPAFTAVRGLLAAVPEGGNG
ncbi:hypothetical protein IM876_09045 [Serratia plymuthica]|uniref:hypothetical protein n=1 Tax=Serratia plymuthica TaxID=82996 RepID=UPI0019289DE7|nr:hypothetical protein [Serratia plymuthica]MBL3522808.1 hypothetical protein [Serratia plymuthica]